MSQVYHPSKGEGFDIETFSGVPFRFGATVEELVELVRIEDIARSLAATCRYNGHTKAHYSTAEHSVHQAFYHFVASRGDKRMALTALLHDAHEAYIGDMTRPLKAYLEREAPGLADAYRALGDKIDQAIHRKWNTLYPLPKFMKDIDTRMLRTERAVVMNESGLAWTTDALEPVPELKIGMWPAEMAMQQFLFAFSELTKPDEVMADAKG